MSAIYEALQDRTDYDSFGTVFHQWLPGRAEYLQMRSYFPGGYKLHVSVEPAEAELAAGLVLPFLRERLNVFHKIASGPVQYGRLNAGRQRGKFITIYAGPLVHGFAKVVNALDPFLAQAHLRPGPRPLARLARVPGTEENRIGLSGLLSYVAVADFGD
jgi:hypothetical protein